MIEFTVFCLFVCYVHLDSHNEDLKCNLHSTQILAHLIFRKISHLNSITAEQLDRQIPMPPLIICSI